MLMPNSTTHALAVLLFCDVPVQYAVAAADGKSWRCSEGLMPLVLV